MTEADAVTRPSPLVTDDSAVFWDAAAGHRLVAQRCPECGRLRHPPRPMCPECHSLAIDVQELSGRGTIYSYSILHHPQNPVFQYPIVAVLVDLEEGLRLVSNLEGVAPEDVRIGMAVEVSYTPTANGPAVPQFRLVDTGEGSGS